MILKLRKLLRLARPCEGSSEFPLGGIMYEYDRPEGGHWATCPRCHGVKDCTRYGKIVKHLR